MATEDTSGFETTYAVRCDHSLKASYMDTCKTLGIDSSEMMRKFMKKLTRGEVKFERTEAEKLTQRKLYND